LLRQSADNDPQDRNGIFISGHDCNGPTVIE